jgi:hypothetical protein
MPESRIAGARWSVRGVPEAAEEASQGTAVGGGSARDLEL